MCGQQNDLVGKYQCEANVNHIWDTEQIGLGNEVGRSKGNGYKVGSIIKIYFELVAGAAGLHRGLLSHPAPRVPATRR